MPQLQGMSPWKTVVLWKRKKNKSKKKTPYKRTSTLWFKLYKAKAAYSENEPFHFLTNRISTMFRNPKAEFLLFTPIHSAFHVLFFHPSPQGRAVSTGGQAAGHQSNKRSADGSNVLCSSVHIQEVHAEDLALGEGCSAQQHIQGFCTAIFHTRACLGADCSPTQGEQQDFVGVVSAHPFMSMRKIPKGRMKATSDNLHALCIWRNGCELLKFLPNL